MPDTHDQTTKTETPSAAFAAVRAWIVKHGYSTGGADNIGYLLASAYMQGVMDTYDAMTRKASA